MSGEETFARLADIVADVLDIDVEDVTEDFGHSNCEDWDSLAQMTILLSVENEFGVKFDAKDLAHLSSMQSILDALQLADSKDGE